MSETRHGRGTHMEEERFVKSDDGTSFRGAARAELKRTACRFDFRSRRPG
jgi:hypothetical protein